MKDRIKTFLQSLVVRFKAAIKVFCLHLHTLRIGWKYNKMEREKTGNTLTKMIPHFYRTVWDCDDFSFRGGADQAYLFVKTLRDPNGMATLGGNPEHITSYLRIAWRDALSNYDVGEPLTGEPLNEKEAAAICFLLSMSGVQKDDLLDHCAEVFHLLYPRQVFPRTGVLKKRYPAATLEYLCLYFVDVLRKDMRFIEAFYRFSAASMSFRVHG